VGKLIIKISDIAHLSDGFKKSSFPAWFETKPCEGKDCDHKRRVKVSARKIPLKGMTSPKCWDLATEAELSWEPFCAACKALQRAGYYAQEAKRFMAKYQELKAAQDARGQGKTAAYTRRVK
jgi:hypothetical protein